MAASTSVRSVSMKQLTPGGYVSRGLVMGGSYVELRSRSVLNSIVRQKRHLDAGVASQQHAAREQPGAELRAHLVDGVVKRQGPHAIDRQRELDRVDILQVGQRQPDERAAASPDRRQGRLH